MFTKNSGLITLCLFSLFILYSQFVYANDLARSLDPMHIINQSNKDIKISNKDIKILAMGIHELSSEENKSSSKEYRVSLLLENIGLGSIELKPNEYIIKLIDGMGNKAKLDVILDHKDAYKYSWGTRDLVTLVGKIHTDGSITKKTEPSNMKYTSYEVTIKYSANSGTSDPTLRIKDEIQDTPVNYSIEKLSSQGNSALYLLDIKNTGEPIKFGFWSINSINSGLNCIDLKVELPIEPTKEDVKISFSTKHDKNCYEYLSMKYRKKNGEPTTILVPIEINRDENGNLWFWDKHGTKITITAIVIIAATIAITWFAKPKHDSDSRHSRHTRPDGRGDNGGGDDGDDGDYHPESYYKDCYKDFLLNYYYEYSPNDKELKLSEELLQYSLKKKNNETKYSINGTNSVLLEKSEKLLEPSSTGTYFISL